MPWFCELLLESLGPGAIFGLTILTKKPLGDDVLAVLISPLGDDLFIR